MAESRKLITDFTGGEVSDRIMARVDRAIYDRTCRTVENLIVHATGGLDMAPGTVFICEAKTNTNPVRLLPFEKSSSEKYVLELSELACRFYKDRAQVMDGANPLEIVTPWLGADLFGLQTAQQENKAYLAHIGYQLHRLAVYGDLSWSLSNADIDVSLAVVHETTPFVTVFSYATDIFTKRPNPDVLPASIGYKCRFSSDGVYFAVAHNNSPYITIYKRSGDTFKKLANPATLPTGNGRGCSFSSDSAYLAVAHAVTPFITIYKRSGDTFTKLADPATLPAADGMGCAFSQDGTYLAVANSTTSPYITIYKRNGDTFTKLTDPATLPTGQAWACAFSPDTNYLAVSHNVTPFITIYKRSGDTFTKLADPATLPTGSGYDCVFSPDGVYFVVSSGSTPYILIYKRSGDAFTKLANPATLPTGLGNGCAFSPDTTYLAVAHATSPYITIYKRTADTFTKLTNPATLPTGAGNGCAFVPEGWKGVSWGSKYPKALTFHDQRLLLGREGIIRGSRTGSAQDFELDAADSAAGFEYSLASDLLEEIIWLKTKDHRIVAGTSHGEWLMGGGDAPITGSNIYADRVSAHGNADIAAILANESLLFVQKGGQILREFMYSMERGGYVSPNLTKLADHIGEKSLLEFAWQRSPRSLLWTRLGNDELAALTLDRNDNLVAWSRQPKDGLVKSIAVVSGDATNPEDTVYLCVQRVINGVTKQYIEYMKPINPPADEDDYFFVECGKTFDYSATTDTMTGAASYPLMDHGDCQSANAPHIQDDVAQDINCSFLRTTEHPYQGSYSYKLTKTVAAGTSGSHRFVDNSLTTDLHGFVPGRKYKITQRIYVPSVGGPSALTEAKLQFQYYDGSWHYLTATPTVYDAYQLLTVEVTLPVGTTGVCIFTMLDIPAETGEYFYVGDVRVRSPVMITATAHPFVNDEFVRITGVVGMVELNGNAYMVKKKAADTFELYLVDGVTFMDGAELGTYVSGGLIEKVVKTLSGLDHLEAKTVAVYADGEALATEVVAAGAITIDEYAAKIQVGLPYSGKLWTQRLGRFEPVRIPEATLLMKNTRGGKIGPDADNLKDIRYATTDPLTGPLEQSIGGRFSREGSIMIVQDKPLPMSILGIVGKMSIGE